MGIIARDRFISLANDPRRGHSFRQSIRQSLRYNEGGQTIFEGAVNLESAAKAFESIKNVLLRYGSLPEKELRPWDLDPEVYNSLDRTRPWWGFEFELGFRTDDDRKASLSEVWDRFDNVCFDGEGDGPIRSEITFGPIEADKYLDGTAPGYQFMEYIASIPDRMYKSEASGVGTHINLSLPGMNERTARLAQEGLGRTLALLPVLYKGKNTRFDLFGRSKLYGGWFRQQSNGNYWLEGKLFRTTYDMEQFRLYVRVCDALTKCTELFMHRENVAVSNLAQMVYEGEEPVVVECYIDEDNLDGTRRFGPSTRGINGEYALPDVA